MKYAVTLLLLITLSCKKSVNAPAPAIPTPADLSGSLIGTYHVTEDETIFYPPGPHAYSSFTGKIIRDQIGWGSSVNDGLGFEDTSNVISFVQSGRNPAPFWAAPGRDYNFGSDTLTFKIFPDSASLSKDSIITAVGGDDDVQVLGKDSLLLTYIYGGGSVAYVVAQTWVKQ
jgi:hypothetical protein